MVNEDTIVLPIAKFEDTTHLPLKSSKTMVQTLNLLSVEATQILEAK